jgi:hypothetical protein
MLSKVRIIAVFLIVSGIICECGPGLYLPTARDAQKTGTELDTLLTGRKIYINSCANCHNLYQPSKYTTEEWVRNVNGMQKRAKIDDEQKKILLKYLSSNSRS